MLDYYKTWLSELLHLSKDALHIHLGLLIFIGACLLLRRSPASSLPLAVLLGLELLNEVLDLMAAPRGWSAAGGLKDILNTMVWPTILTLGFRYSRLSSRRPR